jgi:endonuclease/exonuclease/phosphatase family metal-dependent hydrolase
VRLRAITWNLFHGRDAPPDPALHTWRSRLLRITERGGTHVQVNRPLRAEFSSLLRGAEWDVALLQECPPSWAGALAAACSAASHRSLTSRNSFGSLRALAARINPDLIASGEGGSNLILVRPAAGAIAERRELTIRERSPERRTMAFARLDSGLCIANLHATNDRPPLATEEVLLAAESAVGWAGEAPLLFGGDLNLRPRQNPIFKPLSDRFGLAPPTAPDAIDHLLARGLEVIEPPRAWPPEAHDIPSGIDDLRIRLSDHSPVTAMFELR